MEVPGLTSDPVPATFGVLLAAIALPVGGHLISSLARRVRVRVPRRPRPPARRPFVARALSFLGVAMVISSTPAVAGTRLPVSPHRRDSDAAPPWSGAGGFPPPRPLARTGMGQPEGADRDRSHPAMHPQHRAAGRQDSDPRPLFPRLTDSSDLERAERRAAMRRHPSARSPHCKTHVVREGDSLWSIAEETLGTPEPRAVAPYWPKLHRANRAIIGSDPSVILPGQVLELPSCD